MKQVKFNIHERLLDFVLLGHSINDLCNIFNMREQDIKEMLSILRKDILDTLDEDKFYNIKFINNLIGKYHLDNNAMNILDLIVSGNDSQVICGYCNMNMYNYLAVLKNIYVYLILYGTPRELNKLNKVRNEIILCKEYISSIRRSIPKEKILYPNKDNAIIDINYKRKFKSNSIVRNIVDIGEREYLRILAISDTHTGNLEENFDYFYSLYEYASKHGIKIITHSGDVIEGSCQEYDDCSEEYSCARAQIDHVLNDYLYDKDIKMYIILGNHDASILKTEDVDLFDELSLRDDFVPLGYRQAFIKCGSEYISLKHDVPRMLNPCANEEVVLNLIGHSHMYFATHNEKTCSFKVPTLSDTSPNENINSGFLDIQMWFENGKAVEISAEYIPTNIEQKNKYYVNKLTI